MGFGGRQRRRFEGWQCKDLDELPEASGKTTAWDLETWSKDHPQLAAELWPRVQTLALLQTYYAIPELIEFALTDPSGSDFIQFADKKVLTAGSLQLKYLMALQPTRDVKIRMLRLVKWLEESSNQNAEVIDIQLQSNLQQDLTEAMKVLTDVKDGLLSNEEEPTKAKTEAKDASKDSDSVPKESDNSGG